MNWKRLGSSTAVLMSVIVVSKLIGMARDVVLANYFGASAVSDAYLIAVSVPTLLFYFIGHALSTAYLPIYNKVKQEDGLEGAMRYSNNLMCIALLFSTVLVIVLLMAPQMIVKLFAAGFDAQTTSLASDYVRIGAVSLYLMVIVNIWTGYLQSKGNFVIPAAVSLPRNIVIIVSIVLAATVDLSFLGVGLLVAYIAEFMLLLPFALNSGYRIRPEINWNDARMRDTMYMVLPIVLGVGVSQINKIIDKSIASTITEGGISALSYASVLNNAIQEVAVTGIITVLFANCAALVAKGVHDQVKARLEKTLGFMLFLLVPASVGIIVLAEPIVMVVLGRGNFDQRATALTVSSLRCYTVGLTFLAVRDCLVKVFYAYKDTKTTTLSSVLAIGVNVVLNFVLAQVLGLCGLALATSISAVFQSVFLWVALGKRHMKLSISPLIGVLLQTMAATVCMGVAVYAVYYLWLPSGLSLLMKLCVCVLLGVAVYAICNLVLNKGRTLDMIRSIVD